MTEMKYEFAAPVALYTWEPTEEEVRAGVQEELAEAGVPLPYHPVAGVPGVR